MWLNMIEIIHIWVVCYLLSLVVSYPLSALWRSLGHRQSQKSPSKSDIKTKGNSDEAIVNLKQYKNTVVQSRKIRAILNNLKLNDKYFPDLKYYINNLECTLHEHGLCVYDRVTHRAFCIEHDIRNDRLVHTERCGCCACSTRAYQFWDDVLMNLRQVIAEGLLVRKNRYISGVLKKSTTGPFLTTPISSSMLQGATQLTQIQSQPILLGQDDTRFQPQSSHTTNTTQLGDTMPGKDLSISLEYKTRGREKEGPTSTVEGDHPLQALFKQFAQSNLSKMLPVDDHSPTMPTSINAYDYQPPVVSPPPYNVPHSMSSPTPYGVPYGAPHTPVQGNSYSCDKASAGLYDKPYGYGESYEGAYSYGAPYESDLTGSRAYSAQDYGVFPGDEFKTDELKSKTIRQRTSQPTPPNSPAGQSPTVSFSSLSHPGKNANFKEVASSIMKKNPYLSSNAVACLTELESLWTFKEASMPGGMRSKYLLPTGAEITYLPRGGWRFTKFASKDDVEKLRGLIQSQGEKDEPETKSTRKVSYDFGSIKELSKPKKDVAFPAQVSQVKFRSSSDVNSPGRLASFDDVASYLIAQNTEKLTEFYSRRGSYYDKLTRQIYLMKNYNKLWERKSTSFNGLARPHYYLLGGCEIHYRADSGWQFTKMASMYYVNWQDYNALLEAELSKREKYEQDMSYKKLTQTFDEWLTQDEQDISSDSVLSTRSSPPSRQSQTARNREMKSSTNSRDSTPDDLPPLVSPVPKSPLIQDEPLGEQLIPSPPQEQEPSDQTN